MTETKIIFTQVSQQFDYDTNEYLNNGFYEKAITEEVYNNMTSKESIKFFRFLGGTEKVTRKNGKVIKIISTSPLGDLRTIRTFKFSE